MAKTAGPGTFATTAEADITLLQARRAVLIFAAVTGTIDVRALSSKKEQSA